MTKIDNLTFQARECSAAASALVSSLGMWRQNRDHNSSRNKQQNSEPSVKENQEIQNSELSNKSP